MGFREGGGGGGVETSRGVWGVERRRGWGVERSREVTQKGGLREGGRGGGVERRRGVGGRGKFTSTTKAAGSGGIVLASRASGCHFDSKTLKIHLHFSSYAKYL